METTSIFSIVHKLRDYIFPSIFSSKLQYLTISFSSFFSLKTVREGQRAYLNIYSCINNNNV